MNRLILEERQGPVVIISLNRPERHNSLVPALLEQLLVALEAVAASPEILVVLLLAEGRSFSTGGDLLGFKQQGKNIQAFAMELVGLLNQVILAMIDLRVPIVTPVQGAVTGGSLGLVVASDIVYVTPATTLTPYYSLVGFSPDGGWTAILPAIIGVKRTAEIIMLNQAINAEQAQSWGIASRIVPAHQIRTEALSTAVKIAGMKASTVQATKRLLKPKRDVIARGLESERQSFVEQIMTKEATVGISEFLKNLEARRENRETAK